MAEYDIDFSKAESPPNYDISEQIEQLVDAYKHGLITQEDIMGCISYRTDTEIIISTVTEEKKRDELIESRFEILDL